MCICHVFDIHVCVGHILKVLQVLQAEQIRKGDDPMLVCKGLRGISALHCIVHFPTKMRVFENVIVQLCQLMSSDKVVFQFSDLCSKCLSCDKFVK